MTADRVDDVLVLQHIACEGPAAIGEALHRRGLTLRIVRADAGEPVPATLATYSALIVMGGPMGVYEADRYPHLRDELRVIEEALRRDRPVLGVCLGSQLLAAALGARVHPSGGKEIGWFPVELSEAAASDTLFGDAPRRFTALHWHGDVFDLPEGAVPLASSAATERQAFRYGDRAFGILFHLELARPQLEEWVVAFADEMAAANVSADDILGSRVLAHLERARAIGARIFDRFAEHVRG
jgi:GMP synthase (glutamine-hydrolysing)